MACLLVLRLRTLLDLQLDAMGEDELGRSALRLRHRMQRIDPAVFEDENGFWSLIVEQAVYGQL